MKYAVIMLAVLATPVFADTNSSSYQMLLGLHNDRTLKEYELKRELRLERERKSWETHERKLQVQRETTDLWIERQRIINEQTREANRRLREGR